MNSNSPFAITVGHTCVAVYRKETDERTGRFTITRIHEGVVVQDCGPFVRVFNASPRDKGGDATPDVCELLPVNSPNCWMELLSERKVGFPIPPTLRF